VSDVFDELSDDEIEARSLCWWCYGGLEESDWGRYRDIADNEPSEFNLHHVCVHPIADLVEPVAITPEFRARVNEFIERYRPALEGLGL
jgi:hypothetical protein